MLNFSRHSFIGNIVAENPIFSLDSIIWLLLSSMIGSSGRGCIIPTDGFLPGNKINGSSII